MDEKKLGDMIFNTPDGKELYRLASIRARLRLESNGVIEPGKSARRSIAGEIGLSPRDPYERFLVAVQARIDVLKEKVYRDRMVVEEIGPDFKVQSCDRVAYVMLMEDIGKWRVSFYEGGHSLVKPSAFVGDQATAMDVAELWCVEYR